MGKGSRARPFEVPKDQYNDNWDRIFGKNKEKQEPNKDENKKTK